ncbi:MAG: RagB/SusD family nutrient uptake outer membrane protein [Sphingobacterium sp.]|jgi:hypothetical protein|nr:RagB/SusD family nutrient uptake outer membrane protein [Sphingobacterium sp.]
MKTSKLIYILMASAGLSLSSCEKFLDKTDPTATNFEEFFSTEADILRVVYSSYLDVFTNTANSATVRSNFFYMEEGKSDNAYSRSAGDNHQSIANGNLNSNTSTVNYYYSLHMKHLGRLNTFIANIDKPFVEDESIRIKYKGILEALRCWHYFKLTSRYANVPFFLEPADLSTALQPAKSKEEILSTLFPLAEDIANSLPEDTYTTNAYMFNKYSFKALIMRYALYNGDYQRTARLAKEIMDSKKYELFNNYGNLFNYSGDKINKEYIIRFNKESHPSAATFSFTNLAPQSKTGTGQAYLVPVKALVDSYWTLQGRPIDQCPLHTKQEYELNPKLNRDPRFASSIISNGDTFNGEVINIYDPNSTYSYEKIRAGKSGYWFKKFVDPADYSRASGEMEFGVIRYAEVLLTYAEAQIMQNDVDDLTKKCINDIRRRGGLDMTIADVTLNSKSQQQWIDLIRNERRIEFAGEGLRYDDILRWKIAETVLNQPIYGHTRLVNGQLESLKIEDRSFKPFNYLWPFHESSLKVEPGLKQNPGY